VALRVTRPHEPGLIARKIGSFGFSLYGAPSYLKETLRLTPLPSSPMTTA
jgi:hypothetical protein